MSRKTIAVIPARMQSSRFPGKPLINLLDLPMIEHVRRRALLCEDVDQAIVATCDQEIIDCVESFGGKAVMTADTHERCTDRVEEAMKGIKADLVVILQGDEPLVEPEVISRCIKPFDQNKELNCSNLLSLVNTDEDYQSIDVVKTVIDLKKRILYFSRSPIPYMRVKGHTQMYRQTGLSVFTKDFLHMFSALEPTPLEITESVDFQRILEHGYSIQGVIFDKQVVGVDREFQAIQVEEQLKSDVIQSKIYRKTVELCPIKS